MFIRLSINHQYLLNFLFSLFTSFLHESLFYSIDSCNRLHHFNGFTLHLLFFLYILSIFLASLHIKFPNFRHSSSFVPQFQHYHSFPNSCFISIHNTPTLSTSLTYHLQFTSINLCTVIIFPSCCCSFFLINSIIQIYYILCVKILQIYLLHPLPIVAAVYF